MKPTEIIKLLLQYDEDFFLDTYDKQLLLKDIKCVLDESESREEILENLLMVFEEYNPSFDDYKDEFKLSMKNLY